MSSHHNFRKADILCLLPFLKQARMQARGFEVK